MPNKLAHFTIEAADLDRARAFYTGVFGWTFDPWGPPEFYRIKGAGVMGALQKRKTPLTEGRRGFECSFAVEDLNETAKLIEAKGGRILGARVMIPTVGGLKQFLDTEGNQAIIIEYAAAMAETLTWPDDVQAEAVQQTEKTKGTGAGKAKDADTAKAMKADKTAS